jgi:hypothetical protein
MTENITRRLVSIDGKNLLRAFAVFVAACGLLLILAYLPTRYGWFGVDHSLFFRPAALELASGHSPYTVTGFYSAPWVLLPYLLALLLPERLASFALMLLSLCAFGFAALRLGAKPLAFALFVFSPHILRTAMHGNTDWMVALGFVLPPQIGLFLVLAKPQIGAAIAAFWLCEAARAGWREVLRVFGPVMLALLFSFVLFGLWPLAGAQAITMPYNTAAWPYAVPVGLGLLAHAIRVRKPNLAILAGPLLTPYEAVFSWAVGLLGLLPGQVEFIAGVVGLWLVQWLIAPRPWLL